MSKRFLTDVIQQSSSLSGVASGQLAAEIIAAIKAEIIETGRFSLPDFGSFTVRETPKRSALNPRTGEKVAVKAGATVRFKVAPSLKEAVFAGVRKNRRKAAKAAAAD
ncbi:HU family DNA-binding protein (plasmid) [Roseomonas mucosa]|uniref:HU family DNA-binding protein n=1 Tax=Roseomonas mucosa TaxID=207340 RepID=UPI0030D3E2ED